MIILVNSLSQSVIEVASLYTEWLAIINYQLCSSQVMYSGFLSLGKLMIFVSLLIQNYVSVFISLYTFTSISKY